MFKKVLLYAFVFLSLAWLGYVVLDILSEKNNYDPLRLFGSEDRSVVIVLRPTEVELDRIVELENAPAVAMLKLCKPDEYSKAHISCGRDHVLFERAEGWNPERIQKLFNGTTGLSINGSSIQYNGYEGRFHKTHLYLQKNVVHSEQGSDPYKYDKKASACLIHFSPNSSEIEFYSDIYFKKNGLVNYVTKTKEGHTGKKVNDEQLFAGLVTSNFTSYHFMERDYWSTQDSVFANSPMFTWMMNGFIEIDYQGNKVLISDYMDGQDPVLVLQDVSQTYDTNYFKLPLTSTFPQKNKGYTIKEHEDLVVIAQSAEICDKVIADYKLGQTIALSPVVRERLFALLPQSVSERIISDSKSMARSVYRGKIMESIADIGIHNDEPSPTSEALTMGLGQGIIDFQVMEGNGNIFALGEEGKLAYFEGGKQKWEKQIDGKLIGGLQLIDLYFNNEFYVLLNTKDGIYLYDQRGNEASGFPIRLEEDAVGEVKFYRWKGTSQFLIATSDKKISHYNATGGELDVYRNSFAVNKPISVWASKDRLFAGFSDGKSFTMFDLEKRREFRSFELIKDAVPLKIPNELIHFGIQGSAFARQDQKGTTTSYQNYEQPKILALESSKTPYIILQSANDLIILNQLGIAFSEIKLSFNEVESATVHTTNSGETIIAAIDGLENNVYLYTPNGKFLTKKKMEGQSKVQLHSLGNEVVITTIVDQYLVQYFENY